MPLQRSARGKLVGSWRAGMHALDDGTQQQNACNESDPVLRYLVDVEHLSQTPRAIITQARGLLLSSTLHKSKDANTVMDGCVETVSDGKPGALHDARQVLTTPGTSSKRSAH